MPVITREQVDGYKTCHRDMRREGFCEGYWSMPATLIVETVERTHRDLGGDDDRVQISHEYLHPAAEIDTVCDHCGSPVVLSLTPHEEHDRVSAQGPRDLIRQDEEERRRNDRDVLSAAERHAVASEAQAVESRRANDLKERELDIRERELDQLQVARRKAKVQ